MGCERQQGSQAAGAGCISVQRDVLGRGDIEMSTIDLGRELRQRCQASNGADVRLRLRVGEGGFSG